MRFFARGIEASATDTLRQMKALLSVQSELHEKVRASKLRSDNAHKLARWQPSLAHPFQLARSDRNLAYPMAEATASYRSWWSSASLSPLTSFPATIAASRRQPSCVSFLLIHPFKRVCGISRTQCAGTIAGWWFADTARQGEELIAADLLMLAGPVDLDELDRWVRIGW